MYRAPPGSSRTSGGTALPPAISVGQIYTMYIDFPLDGNILDPTVKALGRRPHIFSLLAGAIRGVLAPVLEAPGAAPGGPGGSWPAAGPFLVLVFI